MSWQFDLLRKRSRPDKYRPQAPFTWPRRTKRPLPMKIHVNGRKGVSRFCTHLPTSQSKFLWLFKGSTCKTRSFWTQILGWNQVELWPIRLRFDNIVWTMSLFFHKSVSGLKIDHGGVRPEFYDTNIFLALSFIRIELRENISVFFCWLLSTVCFECS